MRGFIKHSLDCREIVHRVEASHPNNLVEAEEGYRWTEVPTPVADWSVTLENDAPVPVPFTSSLARRLARTKIEMLERVRGKRNDVEWSGCQTPYGRIDTDPDSQRKVGGGATAALALGASFTKEWRMADNSLVTLDAAKMIEVGLIVVAHVDACQQRKNDLDAHINAAATIAELEAIDVEAGWPG